jgi:prepilin-type N-terminal cleavage/methylation domain-containing protein
MTWRSSRVSRRGLSLIEILIGIMILGIGVISLATLFPLGLLKMKRAVNDTRGVGLARDAVGQVHIRNLMSLRMRNAAMPWLPFAPGGPGYLTADPRWPAGTALTLGAGLPVLVDPVGLAARPILPDTFGRDPLTTAPNADGLVRVTLGDPGPDGVMGTADDVVADPGADASIGTADDVALYGFAIPPAAPLAWAADAAFSSSDDLIYGPDYATRWTPLQFARPGGPVVIGGQVSLLNPYNGAPYAPGTLSRERRYSWMFLARKVSASQLEGPYAVSAIVFYNRDLIAGEIPFANPLGYPADGLDPAIPDAVFKEASRLAYVSPRAGEVLPQIPIGSFVVDVTYDATKGDDTTLAPPQPAPHAGYVYRVVGRERNPANPTQLILTLDQPARPVRLAAGTPRRIGTFGVYLKGAVGVFEKEVP